MTSLIFTAFAALSLPYSCGACLYSTPVCRYMPWSIKVLLSGRGLFKAISPFPIRHGLLGGRDRHNSRWPLDPYRLRPSYRYDAKVDPSARALRIFYLPPAELLSPTSCHPNTSVSREPTARHRHTAHYFSHYTWSSHDILSSDSERLLIAVL